MDTKGASNSIDPWSSDHYKIVYRLPGSDPRAFDAPTGRTTYSATIESLSPGYGHNQLEFPFC